MLWVFTLSLEFYLFPDVVDEFEPLVEVQVVVFDQFEEVEFVGFLEKLVQLCKI